jgi:WS/DGAT/MGAT family acyltransferase
MVQLTGIDASFLYLETAKSPMHIGGVYIFEPPASGEMTFPQFRQYIESRLHLFRTFRERIVFSPLNLGHPYWVADPEFNLTNHLYHIALPKPGGRKELMEAAAQSFSRTLDRNRPLWDITFVEGLDNVQGVPKGSFAMISKVHHAAIDGASGAEMMGAILSLTPNEEKVPKPYPWHPDKLPSSVSLLSKNYMQVFGTPFQFAKFLYETAGNTVKTAQEAITKAVQTPPMPFMAPATIFNQTITSSRVFGGVELSLPHIKAIKNATTDTTVNDVVLAVCAGAFRRYLEKRNELPAKSMVAMCPISVRNENEKQALGNKVSAMLVSLATNEPDPLRRLALIRESSHGSKVYSQAISANQLMNFVPSTLASLGTRLYTSMRLSEVHSPFYNLTITNVPGPPMQLYMNGAKLISNFGTAPVFDGMGILLVIFSYNNKLSISITCTREIMPEPSEFEADLQGAMDELYTLTVKK